MKASFVLAAGLCGVTATQAFVFNPTAASRSASRRPQQQQQQARRVPAAALAATGGEGKHQPQRVCIDLDAPGTPTSKAAKIFREGNYPAVPVGTDPAEYECEWGEEEYTEEDDDRYLWEADRYPERREAATEIPLDTRAWEVQNDRVPVWDDVPNPVKELTGNEWYLNYAPSEMEIEAAEHGFDWTDEWFERNGMERMDLIEAEIEALILMMDEADREAFFKEIARVEAMDEADREAFLKELEEEAEAEEAEAEAAAAEPEPEAAAAATA